MSSISILPNHVEGFVDCAEFLIRQLEERFTNGSDDGNGNDEVEDALDDGFLCIDLNVVSTKLQKWNKLFPQVTPYMAMKCNPDETVIQWLANYNHQVGFDVASCNEFQLALSCMSKASNKLEFPNSTARTIDAASSSSMVPTLIPRLIYANPQRAEQDLVDCLKLSRQLSSLWLTLDGVEELQKIYKTCLVEKFTIENIGLILRILVPDHESNVPLGEKFGTPVAEIPFLVKEGLSMGFSPTNFIGVSFHCGSGCHDPGTYANALQIAKEALDSIHNVLEKDANSSHKCFLLDIGGGFPGVDGIGGDECRFSSSLSSTISTATATTTNNNENRIGGGDGGGERMNVEKINIDTATTELISKVIQPILQESFGGYHIIAEPGRYFVEAAAFLASRIYKKTKTKIQKQDNKSSTNGGGDGETVIEYKISHGVQGIFKDVLLCGESFRPFPLIMENGSVDDGSSRSPSSQNNLLLHKSRVLGPSSSSSLTGCSGGGAQEEDVVCEDCLLPELNVGDCLVFDRMGAYTLSIASRTGRPIVCYVRGGGGGEGGDCGGGDKD